MILYIIIISLCLICLLSIEKILDELKVDLSSNDVKQVDIRIFDCIFENIDDYYIPDNGEFFICRNECHDHINRYWKICKVTYGESVGSKHIKPYGLYFTRDLAKHITRLLINEDNNV